MGRLQRWLKAWPLLLVFFASASVAQMAPVCARQSAVPSARPVPVPSAVPLLKQRSDLRSIALADYLLAASGAPGGEEARGRLQDRARASTDPMLTVMALHMPCVKPGCRNIEASQWSRLDPDNLLAWLALPQLRSADASYLLERVASDARTVRSYREEADALLQDLPPSGIGWRASWGLMNLSAVSGACGWLRDRVTAGRCETMAEGLWSEGGTVERHLAVLIAQRVLTQLPERSAAWEARLREFDRLARVERPVAIDPISTREICAALVLSREGERAGLTDLDRALLLERLVGMSLWDLRTRLRVPWQRQPR